MLGERLKQELNAAQAEIRKLEMQVTEAKLQVEIILMKTRSLTNIAAGVIAEHGGDVEAAFAAVAARMADDRQDAAE